MCQSMVNIQSPTAEIRRGKKKEEERRNRMKIYMVSLLHRATINTMLCCHSESVPCSVQSLIMLHCSCTAKFIEHRHEVRLKCRKKKMFKNWHQRDLNPEPVASQLATNLALNECTILPKITALMLLVFFGNKNVPLYMSDTSNETVCLKLIFTKFACSTIKVPVRHSSVYFHKKSVTIITLPGCY